MGVRRRIFAFVSLAFLGCLPEARAQSEAGLLLGLASGQTLWIAPSQDSEFHIAAQKSRLLVPRDDGFWWVGIEARCVLEDIREGGVNVESGVWINREEGLFITRAGQQGQIDVEGDPCPKVQRKALKLRSARAKLAAHRDSSDGVNDLECATMTRQVTFMSQTLLSVAERGRLTEFCSPAKYYKWGTNVVRDFGTGERITLRSVVPEAEWANVAEKFAAAGEDELQEDSGHADADTAWIVTRVRDKWSAAFWQEGSIAARGGRDLDYTVAIPNQLTSDAPLPIPFDSIKVRFPLAFEAYASPSGAYILVREGRSAFLVRVEEGGMSDTMFEFPADPGQGFVMLRWASADEAARWSAAMPSLTEPVVKQIKKKQQ